ncbi:putative S-adenosylmethionine carrier chloroplastic isoform X1 [Micractinium conductrix]|uniref:S-adenosylmethionine carrier chloroplastic isoform X1 n=1 Tax=Micractinium conductrix TaxID=554055 RepID=A0A2P6V2I2_9CHLO|nr:putative S-adenosylmethionine carrier chloroplastic isoform X1 [Micractinium conductrix]|eukprot:PSC68296.1 putative S-adenosylmethionine carrier chloroplastic isoform X1 [Micractinium conductrix]
MALCADRRGQVELEFELVGEQERPALLKERRRRRRPAAAAARPPFASVAMQPSAVRQHVPAFVVASAVETKPRLSLEGVPQWRITAGNLAAGATAGCAVEAALYPIDTVKTRLQAMRSGGGIRALLQAGGGRSLYAGVWGNLVGVAPASAIFMAVYEPVKQAVMARVGEQRHYLGPLAGGVAAGLASSLVRVPTEVVKTRMQTGEFKHAFTALRTIIAKEGRRGMFAGYGSFLLRDLPFDAIEFGAYETSKTLYSKFVKRDLHPAEHSGLGAVAGAVTGLLTTPLDVLKTRLMLQGASGQYKGVIDCATKIMREEGTAALFRGWEPRVMWIGIGGSVFFTVLEASKTFYAPKPAPKPCCAGKKEEEKKKK